MNIKSQLFLFASFALIHASCQNYSGQQESQLIEIDTLQINDLDKIITTESALLGDPRKIVSMDENHFAVYDHAYKKIMIFNNDGDKQNEFGSVGDGPGEWGAMSGVADLSFTADQFFTANSNRFLFDLYDRSGSHIRSITFPKYFYSSHKALIRKNVLLIATGGRHNSLAVEMDLNEEGKIIQHIGLPESEYSEERIIEQERISYSNGEIPENVLNDVLVARGQQGYFLFMNSLGELRHYSDDGDLIMQKDLPDFIKTPIFDFVVQQNKEFPEHSVLPLAYARQIKLKNDLIYLFMPKPHPKAVGLDFRMLVYNLNGDLLKHYVFADPENETLLYDFSVKSENNIYFIDIMSSEILRFSSDIH